MKREIKFRAWDKIDERFLDNDEPFEIYIDGSFQGLRGAIDWNEDYEIMQCTGIKDKNGVEVYEGDKIKLEKINGKFWEVFYDEGSWELKNSREYYNNGDYYRGDDIDWEDCEVIGNIYEGKLK